MKRPALPAVGVLEVLWLQAVGMVAFAWYTWPVSDVDGYFGVSERVLQGLVPYRDFPFEYPPLALVPLLTPRLLALGQSISVHDYHAFLLGLNVLFSLLTAWCVAGVTSRLGKSEQGIPTPTAAVAIYSLLAIMITPLLAWRYDAFPALLTALGLLSLVKGRAAWAGLWLGLGTVAKIYPMFLVGLWGAYYLATGERRKCGYLVCAGVAAAALVMLPFRVLAQDQWLSFLAYHRERGFEMGSSVAGALWLARFLELMPASIVHNYGAAHIDSPIAAALLPWTLPVMILAVGGMVLLYFERFGEWRGERGEGSAGRGEESAQRGVRSTLHSPRCTLRAPPSEQTALTTLASGSLAMLTAFVVVNKVFSPQYLVWLIPFVPFVSGEAVGLAVIITGLTVYIYPFSWPEYLQGQLTPTLAVNLRNLLMVGLVLSLWFPASQKAGVSTVAGRFAGLRQWLSLHRRRMLWVRVPLALFGVSAVVWYWWPWGPSSFLDRPVGHKWIRQVKDSGFLRDEANQGGERFRWTDGKARLVIPTHDASPRAIHVDLYAIRPQNWENVLSFRSRHPGGVQFAMADGSVHFINDGIAMPVYWALATIQGNEAVGDAGL